MIPDLILHASPSNDCLLKIVPRLVNLYRLSRRTRRTCPGAITFGSRGRKGRGHRPTSWCTRLRRTTYPLWSKNPRNRRRRRVAIGATRRKERKAPEGRANETCKLMQWLLLNVLQYLNAFIVHERAVAQHSRSIHAFPVKQNRNRFLCSASRRLCRSTNPLSDERVANSMRIARASMFHYHSVAAESSLHDRCQRKRAGVFSCATQSVRVPTSDRRPSLYDLRITE